MSDDEVQNIVDKTTKKITAEEDKQNHDRMMDTRIAAAETDEERQHGSTTVLETSSNYSNPVPYLLRLRTNELIPILTKEFMVGKSADSNYQIIDNKKVSRRHAIFRISNGECYIRDNDSTNHTFVNGKLLQPGVEIILSNDDYIRLGDEEFRFWIR